jgi:hypothetical protein
MRSWHVIVQSDVTGDWETVTADRWKLLTLDVDSVYDLILKSCNYEPSDLVNIYSFEALPPQIPPPFQGRANYLVLSHNYREQLIDGESEPGYDRKAHLARLKRCINNYLRAACWVVVKKGTLR